jgi:hypothetical protein
MAASATDIALAAIVLGVAALVLLLGHRPSLTAATGGKVLAFLAFFLLPLFITWGGTSRHIEHSKSTGFCLSCHTMEPYGQSLRIDRCIFRNVWFRGIRPATPATPPTRCSEASPRK